MIGRNPDTDSSLESASMSSGMTEYDYDGGTILIIDDELHLSELMKQYLSLQGYNVLTAQDGIRGLDIFEHSSMNIDLVMLDLNLPLMTGEEVLDRLMELRPDVKVVISSGIDVRDLSDDVIVNASCCLKKPFRMADLAAVLRNVLDA